MEHIAPRRIKMTKFNPATFSVRDESMDLYYVFGGGMSPEQNKALPRKAKKTLNGEVVSNHFFGWKGVKGCFSAALINEGSEVSVLWFNKEPTEDFIINDNDGEYRFENKQGWGWELIQRLYEDEIKVPLMDTK